MEFSSVNNRGQILIPEKIRKRFNIKEGMKIAFVELNSKLIIQPLDENYFESLAGILGTKGKMMESLMKEKKYFSEM